MYNDGVDFTPASSSVLFGYQFKSIAALGPIVGPITAVQFGWLPSFLWLIVGVFFIGWVQDYASIIVPMRSMSFFLGERYAAPMQKRVAPASLAARAASTTSVTSISFSRPRPVSCRADWEQ